MRTMSPAEGDSQPLQSYVKTLRSMLKLAMAVDGGEMRHEMELMEDSEFNSKARLNLRRPAEMTTDVGPCFPRVAERTSSSPT